VTIRDTAHFVGVSKSGVSMLLKTHSETGSVSKNLKGKRGWKRKTTPRADKLLIRKSVICPDDTSKHVQET
jgi:DNA-binding transcriptional regulator GbsR (MarR family)